MFNIISTKSIKTHTLEQYNELKKTADKVNSRLLYRYLRKHNLTTLTIKEFNKTCSQLFYYDKHVCEHGDEYYYYLLFQIPTPDELVYTDKDLIEVIPYEVRI